MLLEHLHVSFQPHTSLSSPSFCAAAEVWLFEFVNAAGSGKRRGFWMKGKQQHSVIDTHMSNRVVNAE
jgi:hypothetical protein